MKKGDYFGRTRRRLEDNIEMDLKEISWKDFDWVHLTKDRDNLRVVMSTIVKFQVP